MDRKNLFPIGEVSRLFHISVSSLRHYENIGLLTRRIFSRIQATAIMERNSLKY